MITNINISIINFNFRITSKKRFVVGIKFKRLSPLPLFAGTVRNISFFLCREPPIPITSEGFEYSIQILITHLCHIFS